jgi:hypothetical protein
MWGAVGSDAVDVGAFGLGVDDGAQLTGRTRHRINHHILLYTQISNIHS